MWQGSDRQPHRALDIPRGRYRVICDIQDGELVVLVLQIAHRSKSYR